MSNTSEDYLAFDFSRREWIRKHEFSGIWSNELNAAFSDVAPYYDAANTVASLGLCNKWRSRFISYVDIRPGHEVLDVCAGTNAVGIELLKKQPAARVYAIDRSKAMQNVGQCLARAHGVKIENIIGDAHHLPFPDNCFDVVTLQWASRHLRLIDVFSEIRRVLKPGGCFYHCDMLRPESEIVGRFYNAYLKACVTMTGLIFRSGPGAWSCRDYFVRAIQMFYSSGEIAELLTHIGFSRVSSRVAAGGIMAVHGAHKE